MAVDGPSGAGPGGIKAEAPSEDSIRVVCRFRPLNDTEERTGSKFVVKFPQNSDDQCVTLGVRLEICRHIFLQDSQNSYVCTRRKNP